MGPWAHHLRRINIEHPTDPQQPLRHCYSGREQYAHAAAAAAAAAPAPAATETWHRKHKGKKK